MGFEPRMMTGLMTPGYWSEFAKHTLVQLGNRKPRMDAIKRVDDGKGSESEVSDLSSERCSRETFLPWDGCIGISSAIPAPRDFWVLRAGYRKRIFPGESGMYTDTFI
jgi:hypothetical protein